MVTPPLSPSPPPRHILPYIWYSDTSEVCQTGHHFANDPQISASKQRFHRAVRWTALLVPLLLMMFATYTRFLAHPAVFDLLSMDGDHEWMKLASWSVHEPHKARGDNPVRRSISSRLESNSTTAVPTVPMNPVLPTPFPQPFDTTLSTNFSTTLCYDFFLNMTQVDAFRSCRPFSLLISSSNAFEEAQNDVDLMNADVWGTCNTDITQVQCDENMSGFASSLQASCQTDLANQVATAVLALNALHAYDLMRNVACQVDPATNSYCYVEAVANSDPSDYWFYQLPLGQPVPPGITTGACNECTSGLMASYAAALSSTNGSSLGGLAQTYNNAADALNNACGSTYAKAAQVSSSSAWVNAGVPNLSSLVMVGALASLVGLLYGS